jgi:hypothetical protein
MKTLQNSLRLYPFAVAFALSVGCGSGVAQPTLSPATVDPAPAGAAGAEPSIEAARDVSPVQINDVVLGEAEVVALAQRYGVRPLPGRYWYDARSGLYGAVGYPAYGFMRPGHDFGTLDRWASAGDTGILINGRALPQAEWLVWSQLLGYWIQPGAYWLDHEGNAGYEGNPYPVVNLYAAARQNAGGGGGGGDNFWSSRFSAGNYNDQGQGYVSVPGYGPVGYGF